MAAAIANLTVGISLLMAVIGEYIAAMAMAAAGAIASVFTLGTSAVLGAMGATALCIVATSQAAIGISLFTAGLVELRKKEKTFKLIAIRGNKRLLLPLLGQQDDLEKFAGQIRYETDITPKKRNDDVYASFGEIEKMMYAIGSRIYARKYYTKTSEADQYKKPSFVSEESNITNFTVTLSAQNCELQCGEYSIDALNKMFVEIWGIESNNFTSKVSPSIDISYPFKNTVENHWITSDDAADINTLETQCGEDFCVSSKPENDNKCYLYDEKVFEDDDLMKNLINCI